MAKKGRNRGKMLERKVGTVERSGGGGTVSGLRGSVVKGCGGVEVAEK